MHIGNSLIRTQCKGMSVLGTLVLLALNYTLNLLIVETSLLRKIKYQMWQCTQDVLCLKDSLQNCNVHVHVHVHVHAHVNI